MDKISVLRGVLKLLPSCSSFSETICWFGNVSPLNEPSSTGKPPERFGTWMIFWRMGAALQECLPSSFQVAQRKWPMWCFTAYSAVKGNVISGFFKQKAFLRWALATTTNIAGRKEQWTACFTETAEPAYSLAELKTTMLEPVPVHLRPALQWIHGPGRGYVFADSNLLSNKRQCNTGTGRAASCICHGLCGGYLW